MTEVHVHLISNKNPKFREAVTPNADGSYSVFINANMAQNQIEKAYRHALFHIQHDDFNKGDIQQIESEAHENAL